MIERLSQRLARTGTTLILLGSAGMLAGCGADDPVIAEKFCKRVTLGPQSGGVAEDLREQLKLQEEKGKVPEGLDGLHGLQAAANSVSRILDDMRQAETGRVYSYGPSAGDEYQYCVDVDGEITAGDPNKFVIVENR